MKKWGIILFVFICMMIWQAVNVYDAALEPKQFAESKAMKRAASEVNFINIEEIYTYFGDQAYVVIVGTNSEKEKVAAWVPEKTDNVIVKKIKSGVSKQEAIAKLKAERNPKEIVSAKLGMEKGVPLWELTYVDDDNRYSFYYLSFEDGTFLKRYSFQQ
jgi:uncharacterized protein YpmB